MEPVVDQIESQYGTLDVDGSTNDDIDIFGYSAYEIELDDAFIVWNMFKNFFRKNNLI
jgi:hypothetical protein